MSDEYNYSICAIKVRENYVYDSPEMLADKRRLWDLWLLTGQKQYLEQYHNEESNPKWA